MNRKIVFLINPISGTKNKRSLAQLIHSKCSHVEHEILHTNAEGNYDWLRKKISTENVTDVVICGGDGSVNTVASQIFDLHINIGIVPLGSGNGLANAAAIPSAPSKAIDAILQGNSILIDAFRINNRFSCMLCGIGFDAQVAHDFAKRKKRGLSNYVKQTAAEFYRCKTYPFEISLEQTSFKTDCFFISIANSNQFGNNFKIARKASLSDGLLDIVMVKRMTKLKFVFAVMQHVFFGEVMSPSRAAGSVYYFQTDHIKIENPSMAPLHIDGEPVDTASHFDISIIPKAFRLIQP